MYSTEYILRSLYHSCNKAFNVKRIMFVEHVVSKKLQKRVKCLENQNRVQKKDEKKKTRNNQPEEPFSKKNVSQSWYYNGERKVSVC